MVLQDVHSKHAVNCLVNTFIWFSYWVLGRGLGVFNYQTALPSFRLKADVTGELTEST